MDLHLSAGNETAAAKKKESSDEFLLEMNSSTSYKHWLEKFQRQLKELELGDYYRLHEYTGELSFRLYNPQDFTGRADFRMAKEKLTNYVASEKFVVEDRDGLNYCKEPKI